MTLPELLVVCLLIGVLAAVATPMFLSQQTKADDGAAKAHARNLAAQVEACYVETSDYGVCNTSGALGSTGVAWGGGPGQAAVTSATAGGYVVRAAERSASGQIDIFEIVRSNGVLTHDCGIGSVGTGRGGGGCSAAPDALGNYW